MWALIVSNGIQGGIPAAIAGGGPHPDGPQPDGPGIDYTVATTGPGFDPDLSGIDLLIVPNGSDHVALGRIAPKIRDFLDCGGTLFCFDGWITPWIPGHRWVMDSTRRTADIRYRPRDVLPGVLDGVDIDELIFRQGVSGWWACGWIDPAPGSTVVLEDGWGRAIVVVDSVSTPGMIVLTASGPLGPGRAPQDEMPEDAEGAGRPHATTRLYDNLIALARTRAQPAQNPADRRKAP